MRSTHNPGTASTANAYYYYFYYYYYYYCYYYYYDDNDDNDDDYYYCFFCTRDWILALGSDSEPGNLLAPMSFRILGL